MVDESSKNKKPLFTMVLSESRYVLGMCEYDKKYLLVDTLINGIYIFDMDTKTKVAIYDVEVDKTIGNSYDYAYQTLTKLEIGHVFSDLRYGFGTVDIKKRNQELFGQEWISDGFIKGNYIIGTGPNTQMIVYQIYE